MKQDTYFLKDLFNKYKKFDIPYYQRKYVWHTTESGRILYKFVRDLVDHFSNEDGEYFIGSLSFCNHDNKVDIVDGQQRLTSLLFILNTLANNFCSKSVKEENNNLFNTDEGFVLNGTNDYINELKDALFNNSRSTWKNDLNNASKKVYEQLNKERDKKSKISKDWDYFYNKILDRVSLIDIEYNDSNNAIRYFLNINSLSAPLSSLDIFYTILSHALEKCTSDYDIFELKNKIDNLTQTYNAFKKPDLIIKVFIQSYYANHAEILKLNEYGIGNWMSFNKPDVYLDKKEAKEFSKKFIKYLDDLDNLLSFIECTRNYIQQNDNLLIKMTNALLRYDNYNGIERLLVSLFKNWSFSANNTWYDEEKNIEDDILNVIFKRLNIFILSQFIDGNREWYKKVEELDKVISPKLDGNFIDSTLDLVNNINLNNVFNLQYDNAKIENLKIPNDAFVIKAILILQEAYLNSVENPNYTIYKYFSILLNEQTTIEHLYSVKEFQDDARNKEWRNKKDTDFEDARKFYNKRAKFENLSLLSGKENSSANEKPMQEKVNYYESAKLPRTAENQFLIQSLVENSPFYKSERIKALDLPNRHLINVMNNYWRHSNDNEKFIKDLLRKALDKLAE